MSYFGLFAGNNYRKQIHTGRDKTMEKLITMSHSELNRQSVMLDIEQKKISQTKT